MAVAVAAAVAMAVAVAVPVAAAMAVEMAAAVALLVRYSDRDGIPEPMRKKRERTDKNGLALFRTPAPGPRRTLTADIDGGHLQWIPMTNIGTRRI